MADTRLHALLSRLHKVSGLPGGERLRDAELLERFTRAHDSAAFEVLLWRHAPMVLGVCRRILRHEQDAEDAFQATFLTLARKGRSISKREAVGCWLYKVAFRIALAAKAAAARRAAREAPGVDMLAAKPEEGRLSREVQEALDEEVQALPEKYRRPLVLYYYGGQSGQEVAEQLGIPEATVRTRLARARRRLRGRLARRGLALSEGLLGAGLSVGTAPATSTRLLDATISAAMSVVADATTGAAGAASRATALAERVLKSMLLDRLKILAGIVLIVATVAVGAVLALLPADKERLLASATRNGVEPGPEEAPERPLFKDVTEACGIKWAYRNGEEAGHLSILESLGGGVGVFDFDGDGRFDLFVIGGGYFEKTDKQLGPRPKLPGGGVDLAALARKDRSSRILGYPCKLYRNLGNFKFEDVTDKVLRLDGPWFYTHGCAVADYDRDGHPDLLLTGWGRIALFHNEKDPKHPTRRILRDVTRQVGLDRVRTWSSSAAFADLDGDGYPDLYLCCYLDWSWKNHPDCHGRGQTKDICPPKNFKGLQHLLFHNKGGKKFVDVSKEAGLKPGGDDTSKGLGVLIADLNRDGKPDLYVANDTVDNFLYFNVSTPGKIRLVERGFESGTARDDRGSPNGSMGLACASYDGSGLPHIFVTNYEGEKHALYHNDWKPGTPIDRHFFSYKSSVSRISAIGQTFVGWGTGFVDIENGGWEDLFIVNGHAIHRPTGKGVSRYQRPVLLRNKGDGTFRDMSKRGANYFEKTHLARGLVLGDLNNDGRVDAVISHMNANATVLKNIAVSGNHWLGIELRGRQNRDVVGARLSLEVGGRTQWRFAQGGGSYASARDPRHVFGLGKVAKVGRLTVVWPDGKEQHWDNLPVDRYYRLTQGTASPQRY